MSKEIIKEILYNGKVVAVVGLSKDPEKASYQVAEYLQSQGYKIIPVNPFAEEVLGEKSYPSLLEIPREIQKTIDIVDVFRKAESVPSIIEQATQLKNQNGKPCIVWMQLGIVNQKAEEIGKRADLIVIMDKCMMVEHQRLG